LGNSTVIFLDELLITVEWSSLSSLYGLHYSLSVCWYFEAGSS